MLMRKMELNGLSVSDAEEFLNNMELKKELSEILSFELSRGHYDVANQRCIIDFKLDDMSYCQAGFLREASKKFGFKCYDDMRVEAAGKLKLLPAAFEVKEAGQVIAYLG